MSHKPEVLGETPQNGSKYYWILLANKVVQGMCAPNLKIISQKIQPEERRLLQK